MYRVVFIGRHDCMAVTAWRSALLVRMPPPIRILYSNFYKQILYINLQPWHVQNSVFSTIGQNSMKSIGWTQQHHRASQVSHTCCLHCTVEW